MSGVEAVGLLLGIIPLIIEAFDHCERTYDAFATYQKYPREIMKIDTKLSAQKTVFRNNCLNLLTKLTGDRKKIQDMVSKPSHEMWRDQRLNQTLLTHLETLDQTFNSCQRTMEQIYEALQAINRETEGFRRLLNETKTTEALGTREWCRLVGTRIRLSLHKPRIDERIEELRAFNADFNLMATQIADSLRSLEAKPPATGARADSELAKYHIIREASQKLYDTLKSQWTCSAHSDHSAHISFGAEAKGSHANGSMIPVRLEMAVSHSGQTSTSTLKWLSVESSTERVRENPKALNFETLNQFTQLLEIQTGQALAEQSKSPTLTPFLDAKGLMVSSPLPGGRSDTSSAAGDNVPDLSGVDDLCSHFEHQQNMSEQSCLGCFKDTYTQRFYPSSAEVFKLGSSSSLADVITWISENSVIRSLSRQATLALAASMSAAVLQYHSTPWLSESWQSRDVWFFGTDKFRQGANSLVMPHLKVDIHRASSVVKAFSADCHQVSFKGARNELLFGLGIILLELGFSKPWPMLRQTASKQWPNGPATDYYAAEKLARLLVNTMGRLYSRITLKCLGCDFGLGESDLSSEELQNTFLNDVVDALQSLHQRFPDLGTVSSA